LETHIIATLRALEIGSKFLDQDFYLWDGETISENPVLQDLVDRIRDCNMAISREFGIPVDNWSDYIICYNSIMKSPMLVRGGLCEERVQELHLALDERMALHKEAEVLASELGIPAQSGH
jgi:hypothetical protein